MGSSPAERLAGDGRTVAIKPDRAGRDLARTLVPIAIHHEQVSLQDLSPQVVARLKRHLIAIHDSLDALEDELPAAPRHVPPPSRPRAGPPRGPVRTGPWDRPARSTNDEAPNRSGTRLQVPRFRRSATRGRIEGTMKDHDIALVGYGPTGMTLAALLSASSATASSCSSATRASNNLPRAACFDDQTMRVFQRLGLVEAIRDGVIPQGDYQWVNAAGETPGRPPLRRAGARPAGRPCT